MILGVSRRIYIDRELDKIKPEANQVTFDGEIYDGYTATQMQRCIESAIRKTKWELAGYDAVNDPEAFTTQSVKLRQQKELYADFSKAADLPLQNERIQVLGFDKSMSSKAVWAERKRAFAGEKGVPKSVERGIINKKLVLPNAIIASTAREKLQKYLLNSNHPVGKHKARVLNSVLGYHYGNWTELSDKIFDAVQTAEVAKIEKTKHGIKYKIPMRILGKNRKVLFLIPFGNLTMDHRFRVLSL